LAINPALAAEELLFDFFRNLFSLGSSFCVAADLQIGPLGGPRLSEVVGLLGANGLQRMADGCQLVYHPRRDRRHHHKEIP